MRILKFGGSSLADPERVRAVAGIVEKARSGGPVGVVVSALGGVTDTLVQAADQAERADEAWLRTLASLRRRHELAVEALAPPTEASPLSAELERDFDSLDGLLRGVSMVHEASPRTRDKILGLGELLSSKIVASAFRREGLDAEACDARELILTDAEHGNARVREDETYERIRAHFRAARPIQVVTGFVGRSANGDSTTLGRGGSDYTAALLGAALAADAVELWTDVDGVMSADPRLVPDAVVIDELGFDELMELSHFGAKVVHPPSVRPTRRHGIPLWIRNTLRPEHPGTRILRSKSPTSERAVRGIASIHPIALLRLEGDGMVGVPGIAMRLFGALARESVSVILISQASSEHSICFAVKPDAIPVAVGRVHAEFEVERSAGLIDDLVVEDDLAVVAMVGAGMRERPGIAGRLFAVLGRHGVNVRAIAQGSSELNVSFVVDGKDEVRAVNAVHGAFFLSGSRTVDLFVAGVGWVGGSLLRQIGERRSALEAAEGVRLRLVAVAGRRTSLHDPDGLDPTTAVERLRSSAGGQDVEEMLSTLAEPAPTTRIFVDCTASEEVAARHEELMRAGVSVVTANKLRLAGPLDAYHRLLAARPGRLYYETTVGAGLPVIRTLSDLLATGDRVHRIEGLLSGTLGFLMDALGRNQPFADAVRSAHEQGYTEPDPREDLGGNDVARKLLILARLAGLQLEHDHIRVVPLLPDESWQQLPLEEFWRKLPELDANLAEQQQEAASRGERLCYLASLAEGEAQVSLQSIAADHPCAGVRGTENLIAFYTDRYEKEPMVIRGPGAGPEVTAAGVFADILRAIAESGGGTWG